MIDDKTLRHVDDFNDVEVISDQYIGMQHALPRGDERTPLYATVWKRVRDEEGRPVGTAHNNPLLDSRWYEVEFVDGQIQELTANIIAENLIAQVDEEGRRQLMMSEIIDHRILDDAIPKSQGTYMNSYGIKRRKLTTRGWDLLVEWKDGSTDWIA